MNFYNKYILPKFLNFVLDKTKMNKHRPDIANQATGVVLEIGFGSGLNLPYYKNITKLYALDPSQGLYDIAKKRIEQVNFQVEHIQASAEKIPLADNSIDTVVSTWTLCSISNPNLALKEVLRILKPGGKFIFIEHGKSPRPFIAKIQKIINPISKCIAGGCHQDREIDKLINEAGFEIQKIEKFQENSNPFAFMYKGVAVAKKL